MDRTSLPPGFRFHPTDVELIMYYLKRKATGKKFCFEAIAELNIYKFGPWDLPDKSLLKSKDLEWYFFCPREKKYASGIRTNRLTECGYWKTTGKDRSVLYNQRTVGMIKTLVFHKGHAPKGERTDWVMHEYRIEDTNLADVVQEYMLCKVFQKSGPGPKNGAQYGAPFNEEEWSSDVEEICSELSPVDGRALNNVLPSNLNNSAAVSLTVPGSFCSHSISKAGSSTAGPSNYYMSYDMPDLLDVEEICSGPSPVDGRSLNHVLPSNMNNSAAVRLTVPGSSCSHSISEPGPSTAGPSNFGMSYDMPDLLEEDIEEDIGALVLDMLTEDGTILPIENSVAEKFNIANNDKSIEALPCLDGNENQIYNDLGDLNNWAELMDNGSAFLELNDLDIPLRSPAEAAEFTSYRLNQHSEALDSWLIS